MNKVYVNRHANNYLCIVSHSFYAAYLNVDRLHRYLPVSTTRTAEKILCREMARVIFVDIFNRILSGVDMAHSSVSHGRNESVMLVNNDPRIHSVGIDIEFIEKAKAPRPFMLNYCEKYARFSLEQAPDNRLCTTIFSCMESLYKALCAISACTFDINDYLLVAHNRVRCVFRYVGKVPEFKGRTFICNCYYLEQSVITVVLLDASLISIILDDLLHEEMSVAIPG
ncbi:UNVERIFIED_ORG: hypothetical protein J2806_000895 [Kosakonia oryzae]|uniref:4'-phosphopantetheinyl transferase superfamily protein n=1 Tax=Kosakonia radicincitans TaxID=283686 RepID=A0AAX2EL08_9ENTR|nr:4'-phosphopantetheinyl transferase superfamily protein [Kosakonia radicincitans]MDP9565262.1 hypothetical protein [Kosakonia oryzae]SFD86385.1 4'-phosphopantetheinyl transferase superfamily protein [Kosakonia radicincitans]SFQ95360.1 4'-phosphopantetheinyl transferase superfamily protein [Kosakonia radicincitans]SFT35146.1 4'-phosphopantetheinyl transferase superfamily protein [Kosakonia radicincitans]SFX01582.1 4'-phosphopantetheinyl transferase superfamily protein [Kosakonia radicincitans